MFNKLTPIFLLAIIAVSGCASLKETADEKLSAADEAVGKCIGLCKSYDGDLDASPCLSNKIIDDWVCDVAHNPRQAIDDKTENQCEAYREKQARHFVELDANCDLVKMR